MQLEIFLQVILLVELIKLIGILIEVDLNHTSVI